MAKKRRKVSLSNDSRTGGGMEVDAFPLQPPASALPLQTTPGDSTPGSPTFFTGIRALPPASRAFPAAGGGGEEFSVHPPSTADAGPTAARSGSQSTPTMPTNTPHAPAKVPGAPKGAQVVARGGGPGAPAPTMLNLVWLILWVVCCSVACTLALLLWPVWYPISSS